MAGIQSKIRQQTKKTLDQTSQNAVDDQSLQHLLLVRELPKKKKRRRHQWICPIYNKERSPRRKDFDLIINPVILPNYKHAQCSENFKTNIIICYKCAKLLFVICNRLNALCQNFNMTRILLFLNTRNQYLKPPL